MKIALFLCIWFFSEERDEEVDNVDDSESMKRKQDHIDSESKSDGKEFVMNIGLKYNNIQCELILVYQIDCTFHTPL